MKNILISACLILSTGAAFAAAEPGKPAPTFEVKDANGKVVKSADLKGKWVVLEWFNKDCPYVKKHYGSGNMQKIQKTYAGKGVTWLTVNSAAKGKQGYLEPAATLALLKEHGSAATASLLDTAGTMGKAYGAQTTPHMYVINPQGQVVYAGAIDNNDSADAAVIPKSTNYVVAALDAGMSGKPVPTASAKPYGCSVKY